LMDKHLLLLLCVGGGKQKRKKERVKEWKEKNLWWQVQICNGGWNLLWWMCWDEHTYMVYIFGRMNGWMMEV
jgi:hypothetical protein